MPKLSIKAGTLSYDLGLFAQDSSVTTGAGLAGLSYNSASLTAYYKRQNATSSTLISLASKVIGSWTSGGLIFVDNTNMPGVVEFGIPNAALATGAKWVIIELKGATNLAPILFEIELTQTDNQDITRFGITALPNANAEAAGGLYTRGTGAGQINQTVNGLVNANIIDIVDAAVNTTLAQLGVSVVGIANNAITASAIANDAITADKIADDAITAAKIATDAISNDALAANAITEIQSGLSTLTATQVDTLLSSTHGSGLWGGASGSGAESFVVTVDDGSSPLDGVEVWVTTDLAGTNTVASGITETNGQVTFMLDSGSYYLWKQRSGFNFSNPEAITVV